MRTLHAFCLQKYSMKKSSEEIPYYRLVWDLTRKIPVGRVTTYGAIADALALGSARMVGWALRQRDRYDKDVPAHRVVNRIGELSGRGSFTPPERMENLLKSEKITIRNHKVANFNEIFWSPLELIGE